MIDVTKGGVTLKVERRGTGREERLTFHSEAKKACLLFYWPASKRWKCPHTGDAGFCRDDDEAFQTAAARLVYFDDPVTPDDPRGPAATRGTVPRRRRR